MLSIKLKKALRGLVPARFHLSIFFPKYLQKLVRSRTQMRIFDGPFKGMEYCDISHASVLEPKLIGIYEKELADVVTNLLAIPFDTVIDIGAAEGYYAVGFARFHATCKKVIAFESAQEGRVALESIAKKNAVNDRIEVLGECTPELLADSLRTSHSLIICDIEGAEGVVLDPEKVSGLASTTILVELHKRKWPGIEETLKSRFAATHTIQAIDQVDRTVKDFPFRSVLTTFCPRSYLLNCVSEFRQPWEETMTWYLMTPRGLS